MVCLLKNEGGLGVLNLATHNDSLLLKFLNKFFSQKPTFLGCIYYGKITTPMVSCQDNKKRIFLVERHCKTVG